jgi:hypothetical protein
MTEASRDLMRIASWGVFILAVLFGGWWRRRRAKRNAELSEALRRPTE